MSDKGSFQAGSPMANPATAGSTFDAVYEEINVPCPTCRGTGRISRGSNNELVALIPFSDSRLKPRRTWIWVSIAVGICLLIGGLVLFFLFPRAITIDSNEPMLNTINGSYNTNSSRGDKFVKFTIVNTYNVTNENYFSIDVTNLSSTALLYGNTIVAEAFNSTVVTIPMHSTQPIYLAMDIKFSGEQEYLVDFCLDSRKWVHTQYMAFQLTANTSYLGHSEQVSKATYQRTSCRPPDAPKNSDT